MSQPLSSRRQFLTGAASAGEHPSAPAAEQLDSDAPARAAPASLPDAGPEAHTALPCPRDAEWVSVARTAMACQFEVLLPPGAPSHVAAALEALDLIDELEAQLTVYRDTSEVAQLNRLAAQVAVPVEPQLFELLCLAKQLHADTAGAFDITAGPLIKVWGFFRRAGKVPEPVSLAAARHWVGSEHLLLDVPARSVRFARAGMEINLGAIGKGYALDRARRLLEARGVPEFLLHGGRSSVLARVAGDDALADRAGWLIGIRHPLFPHRRLAEIRLCNQAMGTSGAGVQFFRHEGKRYGHILDPRTGWPAEGVYSATVVAPTAAEADALATAFYILGPEAAAEYCRSHSGVGMLLTVAGPEGRVEVRTEGLTDGQWQLVG